MSNYTPSPWKTTKTLGNSPAVEPAHEQANLVICYMPFSSPETYANAKLIAAAPDLLEAGQKLLKLYTRLADSGDCGNWDSSEDPEVIAMRAAIAKAL